MQLLASFDLFSHYSSLELTDSSCENPMHEWTQQEVDQRFSWLPGSVAFSLLVDGGDVHIEVWSVSNISVTPQTKRAIVVPFTVNSAAQIEVSDLVNTQALSVPEGSYALMFETGYNDEDIEYNDTGQVMLVNTWCRFSFMPAKSLQAEVLRDVPVPW